MAQDPQDDDAKDGAAEDVTPLDDEPSKGSRKLKKLLIIIVPVLLLAGGAGVYFSGMLGGKSEEAVAEGAAAEGEHQAAGGEHGEGGENPNGAQFLEIPDLLVNLSSGGGPQRFLKLKVKLEVANAADLAALEEVSPRVVDQFQTFLREMRVQDLRGSAGIYRLRQELLYRVNVAAKPVKVKDVLFQEILIQ